MGPVEDLTAEVFNLTGGLLAHRLDLGTLTGASGETVFDTAVAPAGCVLDAERERGLLHFDFRLDPPLPTVEYSNRMQIDHSVPEPPLLVYSWGPG